MAIVGFVLTVLGFGFSFLYLRSEIDKHKWIGIIAGLGLGLGGRQSSFKMSDFVVAVVADFSFSIHKTANVMKAVNHLVEFVKNHKPRFVSFKQLVVFHR